jgi:hypothetical protein
MALKVKTPSMSMVQTLLWVLAMSAALRFVLTRFGGDVGSRIVSYL